MGQMNSSCIAVIDVGKTNKKVIVFDSSLKIVDEAYHAFEERVDGLLHLEDLAAMSEWFIEQLSIFAARYPIGAISVTTHGATAFCIDAAGQLALPPVAYTTQTPPAFADEFFHRFGSRIDLQQRTATAEVGALINVGKKIFLLQQLYPQQFASTAHILFFPQYIGFVLTGCYSCEPTSLGCHTYLYDFESKNHSTVADQLGIRDKLPFPLANPWDVLGKITPQLAQRTGLSVDTCVTVGIHDSNASLLPYLVKGYKNFILNSTGTWCVAMHPTEEVRFAAEELGKLVFYNLSAFSQPVKTSIFMGGLEFETYMAILHALHGRNDYPGFNLPLYQSIITENDSFILPSVAQGTGLFPDSSPCIVEAGRVYPLDELRSGESCPPFFREFEKANAVLNLSLALQSEKALSMAGFSQSGHIFTEGGFRQNPSYNALLATLFPQAAVVRTDLAQATAFGAALLGKAALEQCTPMELGEYFDISLQSVAAGTLKGLDQYRQRFFELLQQQRS
jgi:sugar (pentulose or hexulose) kinase